MSDKISTPAQEPVAWLYEHPDDLNIANHIAPRRGATLSAAAAEEFESMGWNITPLYAAPPPAPAQEHVAWLRYVRAHERPTRIQLCDSDTPGAFKVYAAPPPDEARELLETAKHELIWCSERRHEARVNALVERIRAYLEKHK